MRTSNLYNDHNVYILGAGFSRPAGLPLMKDFLLQARDCLSGHEMDEETKHAFEVVLGFISNASMAAYRVKFNPENIEELFSMASALGNMEIINSIRIVISFTIHAAMIKTDGIGGYYLSRNVPRKHIESNKWVMNGTTCNIPQYQHFAYLMSQSNYYHDDHVSNDAKNTVITFNYDTLLEDSLKAIGREFSYIYDKLDNRICILKPHGSLAWEDSAGNDKYESSKLNKNPLIIPPTWNKSMLFEFEKIWKNCIEALRDSTRIIIIGYSFPRTDAHIRYLLSCGLMENISLRKIIVVDKDNKAIQSNLSDIFRPEIEQNYTSYFNGQEYSISDRGHFPEIPSGVEGFFSDSSIVNQIGRFFPYSIDSN